jgi:hypothetical protein
MVGGEVIGSVDFEDQFQLDATKVGRRGGISGYRLPVANPLPHRVGDLVGRGSLGTGKLDGLR